MVENKLISVSDDGSLLATCSSNGALKLWDTASNILEHEFHPGEYLSSSVTCLYFSPKIRQKSSKKKKKKSETQNESSDTHVGMGTVEGMILLYSISKQKITEKLNHSQNSPVTDISWHSPLELVSLGDDKKIILWSIKNIKLFVLHVAGGRALCTIGPNMFVIGSTDVQIVKYNPETKNTEHHVTPAHKTFISQLVPLFSSKETFARHVLSIGENDRFVYAWSTSSELKEPVGIFMVNDVAQSVSCIEVEENSFGIAVTTKKGFLRFFCHHFNGLKSPAPKQFRGSLTIQSKTMKHSVLPVIRAHFSSTTELIISYGSDLFPRCERLPTATLTGELHLIRMDPSVFIGAKTQSALQKAVTPRIPDDAVHLMPSQIAPFAMKEMSGKRKKAGEVVNLPMEQRLEALSLTQPLAGVPDERPLDNYVHLLIQALHSQDRALMNNILSKGDDEQIINNTVRRLPVAQVVPFIEYLQDTIHGKGLKNMCCISWIKSVLYHHMSHLSSISDKERLLEPFYAIFAARSSSLLAVSKLHARINLLLTHVKNRHENIAQNMADSGSEALLLHKEDSSDEEDMREMEGAGPSESEDIWDDWTEEEEKQNDDEVADEAEGDEAEGDEAEGDEAEGDEAEGDEAEGDEAEGDEAEGDEAEGDEEEEQDEGRGTKRKLENEEEFISLSEDDDVIPDDEEDIQSVSESD